MLASIGLAVVAFASTNVDDIFVLIGFLSDPAYRPRSIVLGQYLGIGLLVGLSLACALLTLAIPSRYIRLLGVAPIAVGSAKLWAGWQRRDDDACLERNAARHGGSKLLTVTSVTIANGGDNLGTYIPMFATSSALRLTISVAVFAVLTAVWCWMAHFLVLRPRLGAPIRRWGGRVLPFMLIAIGARILWNAGP